MTVSQTQALYAPVHRAPGDIAATEDWDDWRQNVAWPVDYRTTERAACGLLSRLLDWCPGLDSDCRDVVVLAGHRLAALAAQLVEWALCLEREGDQGLYLTGGGPALAFLRGETTAPAALPGGRHLRSPAQPRFIFSRRVARILSWSAIPQVAHALFNPRRTAISHNPLLVRAASQSPGVGFRHAEAIMADARTQGAQTRVDVTSLAHELAARLADEPALGQAARTRLATLLAGEANASVAAAASDLANLAAMHDLPDEVWAGTGGYWPSRAIGLEVLRRGGEVVRFSHGGKDGLLADRNTLAFGELAVSSRFFFSTLAAAEMARSAGLTAAITWRETTLTGLDCNPLYAAVPARSSAPATPPRVIYAPTILRGERQLIPPLLPDPVYLDWQLCVAEALIDAPIDLLCKPHPEGLLANQPHPLSRVAPCGDRSFENYLGHSDRYIFDWGESTTFWEALCTDRPVIYLDLGLTRFAADIRLMIERRCRIVSVRYDAANRPMLDRSALLAAVTEPVEAVDATPIRRLLAGNE